MSEIVQELCSFKSFLEALSVSGVDTDDVESAKEHLINGLILKIQATHGLTSEVMSQAMTLVSELAITTSDKQRITKEIITKIFNKCNP